MNNTTNFNTSHMKLVGPCRDQFVMRIDCLDMLLPIDHLARSVWQFVESMDTTTCFSHVNTFVGGQGRSTTSPKILLALWLYSILDGNASARKLELLCKNHNAYKWIAGGAPINRTMLSEFCQKDPTQFDDLLTSCLAVMLKAGLIADTDFSQDGTRVKANAGFNSFRREETLQKLQEEIQLYIQALQQQATSSVYEKRAKEKTIRIQQERLNRAKEALNTLTKERALKKENADKNHNSVSEDDLKNVRASTTDPVVRKMKMGDGGYRLAYNIQFATGLDSRVIFGVDAVTTLDSGLASTMMARLHSRLSKLGMDAPKNWIADAAYSGKEDINIAAHTFPNCRYYAPPQVNKGVDPKIHRRGDSEAVKKWRDSIGTEEVNAIYKKRCSTAEFSNAQVKNRALKQFWVRGLHKVKGMAFLHAIANNISRSIDLLKKQKEVASVTV